MATIPPGELLGTHTTSLSTLAPANRMASFHDLLLAVWSATDVDSRLVKLRTRRHPSAAAKMYMNLNWN